MAEDSNQIVRNAIEAFRSGHWLVADRPINEAILAMADEIERLRAFVTKLANPDFSRISTPLGPLHAAGMCAEAEIVARLAKQVLENRDG